MLIFEPGRASVRWYLISLEENGDEPVSGEFPFELKGGSFPMDIIALARKSREMAYVLEHGGRAFTQPVTEISPAIFEQLDSCLPVWPEKNGLTAHLIREGLRAFPDSKHYLLCETAFFNSLPERARFYALPQPWRERSLRHGSGGLSHACVYRTAGRPRRLVSIVLGDRPSVAAVLNGSPVETGAGFTALEGLPSLNSCGDIDPTIVLDLLRQGLSPTEARCLLSQDSGYQVFSSKVSSLAQVIAAEDLPRRMLLNGLVKAVGTMLSALGGADVIAVATNDPSAWGSFTAEFESRLAFLASSAHSPKFRTLPVSRADILRECVRSFLKE